MSDNEIPLPGGDVTEGVVRVGDTVRRPVGEHSDLVHTVLRHLEHVGNPGAPRFLGIDDQGREILTFVDGDVADRPWPTWVAAEPVGVSVATLLRGIDDSMMSFGLPDGPPRTVSYPGVPDRPGPAPSFLGHRDVTPENVVFREGTAVALIDFDLVRPSTRVDEVTNMLLWWAGWMAPEDRQQAMREVDPAGRGRVLVDAYGLEVELRQWVVPVAISTAQRSWHSMRDRARTYGGGWKRMWDNGIGDQIRRREQWLRDNQQVLAEAVTS